MGVGREGWSARTGEMGDRVSWGRPRRWTARFEGVAPVRSSVARPRLDRHVQAARLAPTRSRDRPVGGSSGAGSSGGSPAALNASGQSEVDARCARGTCTCSWHCGGGPLRTRRRGSGLRPLTYRTAVRQRQSSYDGSDSARSRQVYPDGVAPLVPSSPRAGMRGSRVGLESLVETIVAGTEPVGGQRDRRSRCASAPETGPQKAGKTSSHSGQISGPLWTPAVLRGTVVTCLN